MESGVNGPLLKVIVEQFVERPTHPAGDVEQFERLVSGMIDVLDAESVSRVARALCLHPETPPAIIARLFDKGGRCARVAFECAPDVPHADILATAEHGPVELAAAIARRSDLDRAVLTALASRGETEVLRALAANSRTRLDQATRRALTLMARDDLGLARLLLDRPDAGVDPEILFLAATREERIAIVMEASRAVLADATPDSAPRADADFVARLESFAIARDRDAMVTLLADALDCRKSRARAIVTDQDGEALTLAFIALGVGVDVATRVFLCHEARIAHDPARVCALRALLRSTPARAAARIVAAMTGSAGRERDNGRRGAGRDEAQPQTAAWRKRGGADIGAARKYDQSA